MIFKVSYIKGNKYLLKLELEPGKEVWATTSSAVAKFAKSNYNEGDEIGVDYNVTKGKKGDIYNVTRINQDGSSNKQGANDNPTPQTETKKKTYTPKDSNSIRKQAIFKGCCEAVKSLAGIIDPNNLPEILESLYDKFEKKVQ